MKIDNKDIFFILLVAFLFLIDRFTKLYFYGKKACFLFLCLTQNKNSGGIFGIFASKEFTLFIIFLSIILLILLLIFYYYEKNFWFRVGLIFIFSGILGNLFDRITYGYVVDWLTFSFGFTSFNFSDLYMWVGIIIIFILIFIKSKLSFTYFLE